MAKQSERWVPHDRFYSGYSFILNLGYSPKAEYRRVKKMLESKGVKGSNQNIKLAMEFVRDVALQTRVVAPGELLQIQSQVKQQKMVGGILPPDISVAWQLLHHYLEQAGPAIDFAAFIILIREALKDKISKLKTNTVDKITEEQAKAIERLISEKSSEKVLQEYYEKFTIKLGKNFEITRTRKRVKKEKDEDS